MDINSVKNFKYNNNMRPASHLKSQNNSNVFNLGTILSGSKVTNAIGDLINSFISTVQADDKPKYDYNHPYYHYYQLNNDICSTKQPSCTSDNVFKELKKYPAPGWDGSKSVDNGEVSTIGPYGIGGKVIHVVDDKNKQVTNVTLPGHIFEQGEVRRTVIEDNGKIKINTVGEGVNTSAEKNWLNIKTYREGVEGFVDGFADLDRSIKASYEEKYSK